MPPDLPLDLWSQATRHPFLDGVRDGTLPGAALGAWLVQDAHHFAATRADWRVVTKRQPTDAEWADAEHLVIGTHYAEPTAGHIRRDGDAFRFET